MGRETTGSHTVRPIIGPLASVVDSSLGREGIRSLVFFVCVCENQIHPDSWRAVHEEGESKGTITN